MSERATDPLAAVVVPADPTPAPAPAPVSVKVARVTCGFCGCENTLEGDYLRLSDDAKRYRDLAELLERERVLRAEAERSLAELRAESKRSIDELMARLEAPRSRDLKL